MNIAYDLGQYVIEDFLPNDIVMYIPSHAKKDMEHIDAELYIVTTVADDRVFGLNLKRVHKLGTLNITAEGMYTRDVVNLTRRKKRDCPMCDLGIGFLMSEEKFRNYNGLFVNVVEFFYRCDTCRNEFTTQAVDEMNLVRTQMAYANKKFKMEI